MSGEIPAGRDLTLDFARVICVLLVVYIHILFTGVGVAADGALVIERPLEKEPWFNAGSWILNIMPLFFVVGGFAARAGWKSTLNRGGNAAEFVRTRLLRLARPALIVFAFFAVALGVARALPLDNGMDALIDTIAIGVGSPLWFLGAYMLVQALAPFMIRLHESHRLATIATLAIAAFAVDMFRIQIVQNLWGIERIDVTRYGIGSELAGFPNVLFVWLLCQQVGFFLYNGSFARQKWWTLVVIIVGGFGLLWAMVTWCGFSISMLGNQWPPTLTMGVLAVTQAAALTLAHRPLTALMSMRWAQGVVFLVGSRLMTIYLWHLPMIMILTGVQLLLPLPMPEPGSTAWWWTRIPFFIAVLFAVWILSLAIGRFEAVPKNSRARFASRAAIVVAVVAFVIPTLMITAYGLDVWLAVAGVVGCVVAIWIASTKVPVVTLAPGKAPEPGKTPEPREAAQESQA